MQRTKEVPESLVIAATLSWALLMGDACLIFPLFLLSKNNKNQMLLYLNYIFLFHAENFVLFSGMKI